MSQVGVPQPFPNTVQPGEAVTPYRETSLVMDPPEAVQLRKPWSHSRRGAQIARLATATRQPASGGGSGPPRSARVLRLPGGDWGMEPVSLDPLSIMTEEEVGTILQGAALQLASAYRQKNWWKLPENVVEDTTLSIVSTAAGMILKEVIAGTDPQSELASDLAACPKAVSGFDKIPFDRILKGTTGNLGAPDFEENAGFSFTFRLPAAQFLGPSGFATIYWGGTTQTQPAGKVGGMFALHLTGAGVADLYEYDGAAWQVRWRFRWADPGWSAGSLHQISVLPFGTDSLAFFVRITQPGHRGPEGYYADRSPDPTRVRYQDRKVVSGITSRRTMTGPGPVRLDLRRDLNIPLWLRVLRMPAQGPDVEDAIHDAYLTDEPFHIPYPLPGGTRINITPDTFQWHNTSVTVKLYDAGTNLPVAEDTTPDLTHPNAYGFQSVSGQQNYYVRFRMQSTTARYAAPVIRAYRVDVAGLTAVHTPTPTVSWVYPPVNLTALGARDPTQEHGTLEIEDLAGTLSLLHERSRVHFQLRTRYDASPDHYTVLMEGEIVEPLATLQGFEPLPGSLDQWPSPNHHSFTCPLVGMAARITDQLIWENGIQYAVDDGADPDPNTGEKPCWKITAAIRDLLIRAGTPPAQVDVPDLPGTPIYELRFAPVEDVRDLIVLPGTPIHEPLLHFLRDYLGWGLAWDANARGAGAEVDGMWRLLPPPVPPYGEPLWSFVKGPDNPSGTAALVHTPAAYKAKTTFIEGKSLVTFPRAPEANFLVCTSTGLLLPGGGGPGQLTQERYNPKSFDLDPAHPTADTHSVDYLGRMVKAAWFDPLIQDAGLLRQVLDLLFQRVCRGTKHARFTAPFFPVTDPNDTRQVRPRPLRWGDIVKVNGVKHAVASHSISYDHDWMQWSHLETVKLPT